MTIILYQNCWFIYIIKMEFKNVHFLSLDPWFEAKLVAKFKLF